MKRISKQWFQAALIRAVRTVAQAALATIGTEAMINQVDWMTVLYTSLLAGVLSVLTSLAGLPECVGDDCKGGQ